jgi:hypothetical protein
LWGVYKRAIGLFADGVVIDWHGLRVVFLVVGHAASLFLVTVKIGDGFLIFLLQKFLNPFQLSDIGVVDERRQEKFGVLVDAGFLVLDFG